MERFQRTRGVLRLMAQLIHELWMSTDPSLMIMPGSVPAAAARVQPELLNYLPKEWAPIISGDVDGDGSTPFRIDQTTPNLGQISATRRVARAVFMATAPMEGSQNQGLDTKQVILGVCQPHERPIQFEDALRRLSNQAKFLHSNMGGAWYSRSPSINRLASDRASTQEEALVVLEIDKLLGGYIRSLKDKGPFGSLQVTPGGSADVPDEAEGVRLVVLGYAHPHNGKNGSSAVAEAKDVFLTRGKAPRVYRNTLLFLAADQTAAAGVNEAMRKKLAWESILGDKDGLNLLQSDIALAKRNLEEAERTLDVRLREAWCHLILPVQDTPQDEVSWETTKVVAQDGILAQLGKKLVSTEGVFVEIGARRLFSALSRFVWGDKQHLSLSDVWEFCNRFTYLPRLRDKEVLRGAVVKAVSEMIPGPFAFAEDVGEDGRYDGLLIDGGRSELVLIDSRSVIVKAEVAAKQREEDDIFRAKREPAQPQDGPSDRVLVGPDMPGPDGRPDTPATAPPAPTPQPDPLPRAFYGLVELSADRPARDMTKILEGIIEQITNVPGGTVTLRLEIDGEAPDGFDRNKQRTLLENAQVLGFKEKRLS
jgi:hypothetical protein